MIQLLVTLELVLNMNDAFNLSPVKATLTIDHLSEAISGAAHKLSITELKPKQHEAIISYVTGNDTFIVLPTGFGKSLIYAILPLVFNKIRGTIKCLLFFKLCIYFLHYNLLLRH